MRLPVMRAKNSKSQSKRTIFGERDGVYVVVGDEDLITRISQLHVIKSNLRRKPLITDAAEDADVAATTTAGAATIADLATITGVAATIDEVATAALVEMPQMKSTAAGYP